MSESIDHPDVDELYNRASKILLKPDGVASVFAFLASDNARYVRGTIFTP